jgi:Zn finger protein HypA/HybF involved in hydrogenase expression
VHELAAAQDILKVVLETAEAQQARRVIAIYLKVGQVYGPDRIEDLVAGLAKDTIAEGARLEMESVPGSGLAVESIEVA